mmetsp:Transcript_26385/g.48515  ORF Transcript_26385/g.48515 Transcript_26385/m.48515 type:complete len:1069 (-) Transcript_26385:53-3259(-)
MQEGIWASKMGLPIKVAARCVASAGRPPHNIRLCFLVHCRLLFSVAAAIVLTIVVLSDIRSKTKSSATRLLTSIPQNKVNGVGGFRYVGNLPSYGGEALRTWHLQDLPEALAAAESQQLQVSGGIWLSQEASHYWQCDDLNSDSFWQLELDRILESVRLHKTSAALLWWTVGNEIELKINVNAGTDCLWRRLEWVVGAVKAEDPDHLVGTATAGIHGDKVVNINRLCPSLDFIGTNAYGGSALNLGTRLQELGWSKPYAVMEFGPRGYWSSARTPWGALVEPTSTEKVREYTAAYDDCMKHANCLGSFAFLWGWKWERTGTWFGMLNQWHEVNAGCSVAGCETEVVAAMHRKWTGQAHDDLPPSILELRIQDQLLQLGFSAEQGSLVQVDVKAHDPEGGDLVFTWAVTKETEATSVGGASEFALPVIHGLIQPCQQPRAVLDTSNLDGDYRLYVFVRDAAMQEAYASIPLRVCKTLPCAWCQDTMANECRDAIQWAQTTGIDQHPEWYAGLTCNSSLVEWRSVFQQLGHGNCQQPCATQVSLQDVTGTCGPEGLSTTITTTTTTPLDGCRTADPRDECYGHLTWAMSTGINDNPEWYPGLSPHSTIEEFQLVLHQGGHGNCQMPCSPTSTTSGITSPQVTSSATTTSTITTSATTTSSTTTSTTTTSSTTTSTTTTSTTSTSTTSTSTTTTSSTTTSSTSTSSTTILITTKTTTSSSTTSSSSSSTSSSTTTTSTTSSSLTTTSSTTSSTTTILSTTLQATSSSTTRMSTTATKHQHTGGETSIPSFIPSFINPEDALEPSSSSFASRDGRTTALTVASSTTTSYLATSSIALTSLTKISSTKTSASTASSTRTNSIALSSTTTTLTRTSSITLSSRTTAPTVASSTTTSYPTTSSSALKAPVTSLTEFSSTKTSSSTASSTGTSSTTLSSTTTSATTINIESTSTTSSTTTSSTTTSSLTTSSTTSSSATASSTRTRSTRISSTTSTTTGFSTTLQTTTSSTSTSMTATATKNWQTKGLRYIPSFVADEDEESVSMSNAAASIKTSDSIVWVVMVMVTSLCTALTLC